MRMIEVPVEQARAALWVVENSSFTGRKHPDCQGFAETLRAAGVDLKQRPSAESQEGG